VSRWLVLVALAGCATSNPPELTQARAAYHRAAAGPAAKVTPGLLEAARQELLAAQSTRGDEERHLAYLALRRAETAEASANGAVAVERLNELDRRIAELQQPPAERTLAYAAAKPAASAGSSTQPVVIDKEVTPVVETAAATPAQAARAPAPPPVVPASGADALDRLARVGQVNRSARGVEVSLGGGSLFVNNEARLAPAAMASLEDVAAAVKAAPGRDPVVLEVHTAGSGTREAELVLSQQRAETVRSFLIARGVEPDRLVARGVGTDRPLAPADGAHATATAGTTPARGEDRLEIILPAGAR
jgi:outer membrane protein OmpA-like peptidoglycan-associated protein